MEANLINKIQIEVLKQATNSISNCKLILRNVSGEGISIASPVNMCAIGKKVIWPIGGVIFHILVIRPRIQSVLRSVGILPRMSTLVSGVFVIPVQWWIAMMFLWWKKKTSKYGFI